MSSTTNRQCIIVHSNSLFSYSRTPDRAGHNGVPLEARHHRHSSRWPNLHFKHQATTQSTIPIRHGSPFSFRMNRHGQPVTQWKTLDCLLLEEGVRTMRCCISRQYWFVRQELNALPDVCKSISRTGIAIFPSPFTPGKPASALRLATLSSKYVPSNASGLFSPVLTASPVSAARGSTCLPSLYHHRRECRMS